nr:hypothetical protein Itr_chr04CG02310 [Ipomoea trifida]
MSGRVSRSVSTTSFSSKGMEVSEGSIRSWTISPRFSIFEDSNLSSIPPVLSAVSDVSTLTSLEVSAPEECDLSPVPSSCVAFTEVEFESSFCMEVELESDRVSSTI